MTQRAKLRKLAFIDPKAWGFARALAEVQRAVGLILNSTYHLVGCQNDGDP